MHRSDKYKIIGFLYFLVVVGLVTLFWVFGKSISGIWLFGITLAVQQLYFMPMIHKNYHKLHDVEENTVVRFIPWLNELAIFSPFWSRINLVMGILVIFFGVVAVLPVIGVDFVTVLVTNIFGDSVGMSYSFYCLVILASLYLIMSFTRGFGFIEIKRAVDYKHNEAFPKAYTPFEAAQYLLLLFPLCRTLSVALMSERLVKLVDFNDLDEINAEKFVEEI